jgi:hypothetical protein
MPAGEERKESLSEQLWAAYRAAPRPKPCAKELMEAFAFLKKVEPLIFKRKKGSSRGGAEVALDVCGGHGILALLLVIYRKARRAILLDIDTPRSFATMCTAWEQWLPRDDKGPVGVRAIECRHGDVYTTLPAALAELEGTRVAVCGIHACDFLTDLCMDSAMAAGQNFAVMPCCHVDRHKGQLKQAASSCQISVGQVLDIMRLGRVWERGYTCHWRTIDRTITAENRVLIGTAPASDQAAPATAVSMKERERLMERYREYHRDSRGSDSLSDSLEVSVETDDDGAGGGTNSGARASPKDSSEEDEMPCSCAGCCSGGSGFTGISTGGKAAQQPGGNGNGAQLLLEEEPTDESEDGVVLTMPPPKQPLKVEIELQPYVARWQPANLLSAAILISRACRLHS